MQKNIEKKIEGIQAFVIFDNFLIKIKNNYT